MNIIIKGIDITKQVAFDIVTDTVHVKRTLFGDVVDVIDNMDSRKDVVRFKVAVMINNRKILFTTDTDCCWNVND